MKLYIAGPMSGYKDYNYPAFHKEAALLRKAGYEVVNPAEINGSLTEAMKLTYNQCLRADIKQLLDCNGVATLPEWQTSFGASLEVEIANRLDMEVRPAVEWRNPVVLDLFGKVG